MGHKFLVADDSQTIQKVIKITLEPEGYNLIECLSEDNLLDVVTSEDPDVVLLDFNISENKTGYDLIKSIKEIKPTMKFLILFGTFDTIDESLLEQVGASQYIVKPFDGNQFISLCRGLVSDLNLESEPEEEVQDPEIEDALDQSNFETDEETEMPGVIEPSDEEEVGFPEEQTAEIDLSAFETEADEEWIVNQPEAITDEIPVIEESAEENVLEQSLKDWTEGLETPELPPIISEASADQISVPAANIDVNFEDNDFPPIMEETAHLPDEDDLEYPDLITSSDSTPGEIKIAEGGTSTEEQVTKLEELIEDETVEAPSIIKNDDMDEEIEQIEPYILSEIQEIEEAQVPTYDEEIIEPITTPDDFPEAVYPTESISEEKIEQIVRKVLQELLEDKLGAEIKNIAWEVIPDLAENLIKSELENIKSQVLDQE